MSPSREYLTTKEAEDYTGLRDMAERRVRGNGPEFIKTGAGRTARVLYSKTTIDAWLRQRTRQRTSDSAPAAA